MICVAETEGKGRGLIAVRDIRCGEVIETCSVHLTPVKEKDEYEADDAADRFVFYWDENYDALAFGSMSFVNHSRKPNCEIVRDENHLMQSLIAMRDIKRGEELTIDYEYVWFEEK